MPLLITYKPAPKYTRAFFQFTRKNRSYYPKMEINHTEPDCFESLVYDAMLPFETIGDYRLRYEDGSSAPPYLPVIEITKLNQERDTDYLINSLIRPFEKEVVTQYRNNPRYIEITSRRFEQAWQFEDYYTNLIEVWEGEKWLPDKQKGWRNKRTELNSLLDTFGFSPGDQDIELTAEQHEQTKPLYDALAWFAERIAEYQHGINRAKDAIRIIRETRAILRHYQPAPDKVGKPAPENSNKRGPYRNSTKNAVLKYYEESVKDQIEKAIRNGIEPDRAKIEERVQKAILEKEAWKLPAKTLRDWLPATKRAELFGEFQRQVSARNAIFYK
jgi:hypothetical protein